MVREVLSDGTGEQLAYVLGPARRSGADDDHLRSHSIREHLELARRDAGEGLDAPLDT